MNAVLKRVLTGMTIGAAVIAAIVFAPVDWFRPIVLALSLCVILEYHLLLARRVRRTLPKLFWTLVGALVIVLGLGALPAIVASQHVEGTRHGNLMLLYILAIVKFSDVGGFAVGMTSAKLMKGGNHKLCPSVSPGKSWEGLVGSIIFSTVVSLGFLGVTGFSVGKAVFFGCVAALVGTAGDLVESKFKRWVGVKDSSQFAITNGLGGFLDMVDSVLFAPAVLASLL